MGKTFVSDNKELDSKRKIKKIAIIFLVVILITFITILAITPHLVMGEGLNNHVNFNKIYTAEEFGISSKKLLLTTSDGLDIAAYEVYTPYPKAVVIFISGIHNPSVTAFYGHSKMLKDNGYGSILMEMRAHGESEGDVVSLGYKEYLDTQAVVDYIKSDQRYTGVPIVVYGVSMGGATAINSIGKIPEIDGLISMSAYASFEDMFSDNMLMMGVPKFYTSIQKPFVNLYANIKYGLGSSHISPKEQIKNLGDRPALIIHSKGDLQVPYGNFDRIIEVAPSHVETWVREGDLHFIVEHDNFIHPQKDNEYAKRIIEFLDDHFGDI